MIVDEIIDQVIAEASIGLNIHHLTLITMLIFLISC
ncbi:hypothetical protein NMY3_03444 [Candidatus Nitrosocosmicus oleophilus]|uniref:Uncharacterized protein n=1 Tax=Candidatus Nitrosocosmicus oleophilus TaxID=1353260 RepID=A0A654M315_9ARCH|nr:hypothetical protein NMY3_03444 [Candidatus Nitrosocosmicus oleophilus]